MQKAHHLEGRRRRDEWIKVFMTVIIKELNWWCEMAFYGARYPPKNHKPLQNKVFLICKMFSNPSLPGPIHNQSLQGLPPIIVWKYQRQ
jgi:hypothetical protein